ITYDYVDGGNVKIWQFNGVGFVENVKMRGNLDRWRWAGGQGIFMYAGNFVDDDGFTKLDDLLIYSQATKEVIVLVSRRPYGDYARFWVWYGPYGDLLVQPDEELTVATFTGGLENIVLNAYEGSTAGQIRAFTGTWPPTKIGAFFAGVRSHLI